MDYLLTDSSVSLSRIDISIGANFFKEENTAIVVLGHREDPHLLLGEQLMGRLTEGIALWRDNPASSIIFAGGPNDIIASQTEQNEEELAKLNEFKDGDIIKLITERVNEYSKLDEMAEENVANIISNYEISFNESKKGDIPESKMMRAYTTVIAELEGNINPENIFNELDSRSTAGNAYYVWELIDENQLPINHLLLVTSDFHAQRAKFLFSKTFPLYPRGFSNSEQGFLIEIGSTFEYEPRKNYEGIALKEAIRFFNELDTINPEKIGENLAKEYDKSYRDVMTEATRSDIIEAVRNKRQRWILDLLYENGDVLLRDLVEKISILETGSPLSDLSAEKQREIYTELMTDNIPHLEEKNIIYHKESVDKIEQGIYFDKVADLLEVLYHQ